MKGVKVYIIITSLILLQSSFLAMAQSSSWQEWTEGKIYTSTRDTLYGKVLYEDGIEIVQFIEDGNDAIQSFSAFTMQGFELVVGNKTKFFDRYYWNRGFDNHKKMPDFFMTLYSGQYKLLAKEKKIIVIDDWPISSSVTLGVTPLNSGFPIYSEKVILDHFIMDITGDIHFVISVKRLISDVFSKQEKELKELLKGNKSESERKKLVLIIDYLESKKE